MKFPRRQINGVGSLNSRWSIAQEINDFTYLKLHVFFAASTIAWIFYFIPWNKQNFLQNITFTLRLFTLTQKIDHFLHCFVESYIWIIWNESSPSSTDENVFFQVPEHVAHTRILKFQIKLGCCLILSFYEKCMLKPWPSVAGMYVCIQLYIYVWNLCFRNSLVP